MTLVGAETLPGLVPGLKVVDEDDDCDDDWQQIDEVIITVEVVVNKVVLDDKPEQEAEVAERRSIFFVLFCFVLFSFKNQ